MRITTTPHDDDDGLTVEVRDLAGLAPHVIGAMVGDAVTEAASVLVIPPVQDEHGCPVGDSSCEGSWQLNQPACHDACEAP